MIVCALLGSHCRVVITLSILGFNSVGKPAIHRTFLRSSLLFLIRMLSKKDNLRTNLLTTLDGLPYKSGNHESVRTLDDVPGNDTDAKNSLE